MRRRAKAPDTAFSPSPSPLPSRDPVQRYILERRAEASPGIVLQGPCIPRSSEPRLFCHTTRAQPPDHLAFPSAPHLSESSPHLRARTFPPLLLCERGATHPNLPSSAATPPASHRPPCPSSFPALHGLLPAVLPLAYCSWGGPSWQPCGPHTCARLRRRRPCPLPKCHTGACSTQSLSRSPRAHKRKPSLPSRHGDRTRSWPTHASSSSAALLFLSSLFGYVEEESLEDACSFGARPVC